LRSHRSRARDVTARDDAGKTVTLPAPAQRVISLAPHATELIYAAAAARSSSAPTYSDYPPAARACRASATTRRSTSNGSPR
jgi:ABC-type Fe3+-hydroxamate transport system substrate-binding protein